MASAERYRLATQTSEAKIWRGVVIIGESFRAREAGGRKFRPPARELLFGLLVVGVEHHNETAVGGPEFNPLLVGAGVSVR